MRRYRRKTSAFFFVVLCSLIALISRSQGEVIKKTQTQWKTIAEVKPAVVLIIAKSEEGWKSGSGFIISENGYILTNDHVVRDADEVVVYVKNQNEYKANIIISNQDYDISLLKINASNLITVRLGNSDELKEGEDIGVTGYPLIDAFLESGFSICASTSKGGVSAIREAKTNITYSSTTFIQTDAAVNPGNSGGPLYLLETGEVMGIAVAKLQESEGLNLAIPINIAKRLIQNAKITIKSNSSTPLPFAKPEPEKPSTVLTALDYLLRGNSWYDKNFYNQAISDYTKAIEINPRYAEAYNNRGNVYGNKGFYDQAISDYNQALKINPRLAEAYNNRGVAYDDKGLYDEAISDYNQALEINPGYAEAYNNRGNAYAHKGDYDQAIFDYNQALEINPGYAEAYNNRGLAYANKGDYNQAISDYNKAIKINPRFAGAYYNQGNVYYNKGFYDQAISDFNKALEINPKDAGAYNNRGLAYDNKGFYDQAISDFNKALEINPRYAEAYNNRGLAYDNKGLYDQAISDFNKALEINPRLADVYNNRGIAYYFKREYDKAWEDVHKAQSLGSQVDPEFLKDLRKASGRQR